ncbi:MAG: type II toxin-antitoxin system HicA family toxin [Desulfamplus sp.]|nr:type II toxin-antitoxin system HicA family toxin [Desulfamplus sp.]
MPKKIKELIKELEKSGFINRGGKGSHRNFVHPLVVKPVVISGQLNDDAHFYQEKAVKIAIEDSEKCVK